LEINQEHWQTKIIEKWIIYATRSYVPIAYSSQRLYHGKKPCIHFAASKAFFKHYVIDRQDP